MQLTVVAMPLGLAYSSFDYRAGWEYPAPSAERDYTERGINVCLWRLADSYPLNADEEITANGSIL